MDVYVGGSIVLATQHVFWLIEYFTAKHTLWRDNPYFSSNYFEEI